MKKRLVIALLTIILVAGMAYVSGLFKNDRVFVLDEMGSSGPPPISPSSSQPMGTTGGPSPSGSASFTPPPTTSGPPPSPSGTPTPSMSMSPTPSGSQSPTPTPSMSGSASPTLFPETIDDTDDEEEDFTDDTTYSTVTIEIHWQTTQAMTGIKNMYLGAAGTPGLYVLDIDLAQSPRVETITGPYSYYLMKVQTGYCFRTFYETLPLTHVDLDISPYCYDTNPPTGKATVYGYVYQQLNPTLRVADATVTIATSDNVVLGSTNTNANGEYKITNITSGVDYKLVVHKKNFASKTITGIGLSAGENENINIGLSPPPPPLPDLEKFSFVATLKYPNSTDFLGDARVTLTSPQWVQGTTWSASSSNSPINEAAYGSDVNVLIHDIPVKDNTDYYSFEGTVEHPSFNTGQFNFHFYVDQLVYNYDAQAYVYQMTINVGTPRDTLTLKGRVRNTVTDELIPDADVSVEINGFNYYDNFSTTTNANGVYTFNDFPIIEGKLYTVTASHEDFRASDEDFTLQLSQAGTIVWEDLRLFPTTGNYIYGKVTNQNNGNPIIGATVSIVVGSGFSDKTATTNNHGRYYIEDVGYGTMTVRAHHPDYSDDSNSLQEVSIPEGKKFVKADFALVKATQYWPGRFNLNITSAKKVVNGVEQNIDATDVLDIDVKTYKIQTTRGIFQTETQFDPGVDNGTIEGVMQGTVEVSAILNTRPDPNNPQIFPKYSVTVSFIKQDNSDYNLALVLNPIVDPLQISPPYDGKIIGETYIYKTDCMPQQTVSNPHLYDITPAPGGLPVFLYGYRGMPTTNPVNEFLVDQTTTDSLGRFSFSGLERYDVNPPNEVTWYRIQVGNVNSQYTGESLGVPGLTELYSPPIGLKPWFWFEGGSVIQRQIWLEGKTPDYKKTINIRGSDITFYGYGALQYETSVNWEEEMEVVQNALSLMFGTQTMPDITIVDSREFKAELVSSECSPRTILITTRFLRSLLAHYEPLYYTIINEYAKSKTSNSWYENEGKPVAKANTAAHQIGTSCPFDKVLHSNIAFSKFLNGSPDENRTEWFASYFNAYFLHHQRLYEVITKETEASSECQHVLKYMWQYFSENIGKVYENDNQIFHPLNGALNGYDYNPTQIRLGDWIDPAYR